MNRLRVAEILLAAECLAGAAKLEGREARELLGPLLDEARTRTHVVDGADGAELGTITRTPGRAYAKVSDERALLAWVKQRHPGEIVEIVRPSYLTTLLDFAKRQGDACDPGTGEVIPGIAVSVGEPGLRVLPNQRARDLMRTLLATSGALPMIEGASDGQA